MYLVLKFIKPELMEKKELITKLKKVLRETNILLENVGEQKMFISVATKWSVAEQIEHLSLSFFATNLAFALPQMISSTLFGTNTRPNMTYEEVVDNYLAKLNTGSKASFTYQPKISMLKNRKWIIKFWSSSQKNMLLKIETLNEDDLDTYLIPHPIIGKMTWREFLYFTHYHIEHHLKSMKQIVDAIA